MVLELGLWKRDMRSYNNGDSFLNGAARDEQTSVGGIVIMVASRPRIFRELLTRALKSASNAFHVLEVTAENELLRLLRQQPAQWLIVSAAEDGTLPATAQAALSNRPGLGALAVSPDGSRIQLVAPGDRDRSQRTYENISLDELISVLSTAPQAVAS
jgi:hypothetical protein